jgi:Cu2+-exporting ATPase
VRQNVGLSLCYNLLAVPLAVLGFVTPLVAALSMSTSSILVVLNSARLGWRRGG